ncbi:hypothetical protein CVT26_010949 [Gymnopilus dilepis]|uniref:Uncharacterized protein n=1 Tax=Gymnopilus dilepis TaxID=231916 RepID=A0A409VJ20_9AGAR|nr:hypothetical protein CVT26_010949 [Gymnopilus dilepis]
MKLIRAFLLLVSMFLSVCVVANPLNWGERDFHPVHFDYADSITSTMTGILCREGCRTNITMFYNTCKSFFLNQDTEAVEYCRLTWAEKLQLMFDTCHSRGARCTGPSGTWSLTYVELIGRMFFHVTLTDVWPCKSDTNTNKWHLWIRE